MKFKDISVGMQLRLAFGVILVFVVALGATAYYDAQAVWQATQGLYEHPLRVRHALGDFKADVLAMHRDMKDLVLSEAGPAREAMISDVDKLELDGHEQLDVLYAQYLGPRKDVDDIRALFVQWKSMRGETIALLREGKIAQARERAGRSGAGGAHVDKMLREIGDVSGFAAARADKFYQDAQVQKDALLVRLWVTLAAIFVLAMGTGAALLRGIRGPLKELTRAADEFREGHFDARSRYRSGNELGVLSGAFNGLAETVQAQVQAKDAAANVAGVMLRHDELGPFCRELLTALMEPTGSQVGAVYLLDETRTRFEHFESIGFEAAGRTAFSALVREGEFGPALAGRKVCRVADIPADSKMRFCAVAGEFLPRDILTIPILGGADVVAVISLASVREYSPAALRLVDDLLSTMTARLNGVLAHQQVRAFSEKLSAQNRELEAQQKELTAQADELKEQNIELDMQKRQLDEASRLKSVFLSNMSHELRTPLNAVIGLSGVLSRRLQGALPAEEFGYLEVIERNGKNLLALINDILDLSRIEAGRTDISLEHVDVRELVGEIVATVAPAARDKSVEVRNAVGADVPALVSDPVKCRHILQNIIANAVKFTEVGHVEIAATPVDHSVRITVADTGVGIAPEHIGHIFDEFRQADEGTSRRFGGTGLGLAIARKYARMLGGAIEVASQPGQGSVFTVTLPLVASGQGERGAVIPASRVSAPVLGPRSGQGKTVLVVEDSAPAIVQIKDILAGEGYRVEVARNGKEALEHLALSLPDGIILDLMMPEVDGFEVLRVLRSQPRTATLPALILTAKQVSREELASLKGNHIHQLIQKGDVNKAQLLAAVGAMVSPASQAVVAAATVRPPRRLVTGTPAVLVVEDNPDNRKTVRAILDGQCAIEEAQDGPEAIEALARREFDLVLLDISLPSMDGFQVLDAIRSGARGQEIAVIALTARAMKGDREEILTHDFDAYISKPVDEQVLLSTIREIVGGKQGSDNTGH